MSLPSALTTVTVTGTRVKPDGSAAAGYITFTPTGFASVGGTGIVVTEQRATLDASGAFTATLIAGDDTDLRTPLYYAVVERITGQSTRVYNIQPKVADAPSIALDSLAQVVPVAQLGAAVKSIDGTSPDSAGNVSLSSTYVTAFFPEKYGAKGDGVTDDTAAIQAAINASADKGAVWLSGKIYRCDGQLTIPEGAVRITSGSLGKIPPNWAGTEITVGPILDLRYASATYNDAKIQALQGGTFELDHVVIVDKGTSNNLWINAPYPIVRIHDCLFQGNIAKTQTTCDQDVIRVGALYTTGQTYSPGVVDSATNPMGSYVRNNYFSHIRRAVQLGNAANGFLIEGNANDTKCGSNQNPDAPYVLDSGYANQAGTTAHVKGAVIRGNTIEETGYAHGIILRNNAQANWIIENGFWDHGGVFVSHVLLDESTWATGNLLDFRGYHNGAPTTTGRLNPTYNQVLDNGYGFSEDDHQNVLGGTGAGVALTPSGSSGVGNTAIGHYAVHSATTGSYNTGVGFGALQTSTTAGNNTAVGHSALGSVTTAGENTAVGNVALNFTTTGANNAAVGSQALNQNTTGHDNTAVGYYSLRANTAGFSNVAVGSGALSSNTTNENVGVGYYAGGAITTGSANVALGTQAGNKPNNVANSTTTGSAQTLVGYQTGQGSATQRTGITCLGYRAIADGDYAIAIGHGTSAGAAGAVAIGKDSSGTAASTTTANEIALGTATHQVKVSNNATGAGSAALGANCPATTATAPYTWFKMTSADGSTVFIPAWK